MGLPPNTLDHNLDSELASLREHSMKPQSLACVIDEADVVFALKEAVNFTLILACINIMENSSRYGLSDTIMLLKSLPCQFEKFHV
jgi:hypothetical protein